MLTLKISPVTDQGVFGKEQPTVGQKKRKIGRGLATQGNPAKATLFSLGPRVLHLGVSFNLLFPLQNAFPQPRRMGDFIVPRF